MPAIVQIAPQRFLITSAKHCMVLVTSSTCATQAQCSNATVTPVEDGGDPLTCDVSIVLDDGTTIAITASFIQSRTWCLVAEPATFVID